MKDKILLIFPPMMSKYAPNSLDIPVPHIGIAYIASLLRLHGFDTEIIDCPAQEIALQELYNQIDFSDYRIIGISTYYFNSANVIRIAQKIKRTSSDTFVFLGGMLPTLSTKDVLKSFTFIDCCVIGEGELTVLELVTMLLKVEEWRKIDGIGYLNFKKEIIINAKRKLIDDLDQLPFPVRVIPKRELYTPILTSRGCYGNCNFCSIESYFKTCIGKKVRMRNPINVVDEIEELVKKGHTNIKFNDENFNVSSKKGKKWFADFYKEIKKRKINAHYIMDMRVNEIINGKDEIRRFIDIGLDFIFIGVESFIQRHLDFFKKNVSVEENIKAMRILDELNANYRIGLLLFNPITRLEEIKESLDIISEVYYLRENNMMKPISIFQPVIAVGGTEIYDYIIKAGLYENNGRGYRFQDERVEIYYNICKKWSKYINDIYERRFEIGDGLYSFKYFREVYKTDLKFMKEVVKNMLAEGIKEEEFYNSILEEHYMILQEIDHAYILGN